MKYSEIERRRGEKLASRLGYQYLYYQDWDYSILNNVMHRKKNGSRANITYSECYIMLDTETSKDHPIEYDGDGKALNQINHICAFTCSIRAFHRNIVTLRGSKPSEIVDMLQRIRDNINADVIFIFIHNLPFDIVFLRRYLYKAFGTPKKQLNVKNHQPITMQFKNGIILRDSLILSGVPKSPAAERIDVNEDGVISGLF